jgi:hypothetical protein
MENSRGQVLMTLTLDLVPKTSFFQNFRTLRPKDWEIIRQEVYRRAGHCCEICKGQGPKHPVEAHERWDYDQTGGTTGVQKLVGLVALCPACHEVCHFGLATLRGRERQARRHLMDVNGWSDAQADRHIEQAFLQWHRRGLVSWELDISFVDTYIDTEKVSAKKQTGNPLADVLNDLEL